jgi:hypothetical protein
MPDVSGEIVLYTAEKGVKCQAQNPNPPIFLPSGASDDLSQVELWAFICVGSLMASLILLVNLSPRP